MKRFQIKTVTWYAIVGLLVAVAVLPILKSMAPEFFPEGFRSRVAQAGLAGEGFRSRVAQAGLAGEGFRSRVAQKAREGYEDSGCRGITCEEGQFCTNAKCVPRYVGSAQVPEGNE